MPGPLDIFDPLYGKIHLPRFLEPFLLSPEFRRLGGVRLLNFESLELAALSEVRRRSHTLGVLHLGTRLTLLDFGPEEIRALLYATVLHDIGTPPFGHTIEYEFIRRLGRDHEDAATRLLEGRHHPYGRDHQMFAGKMVALPDLIQETGCAQTIRDILSGTHPLSTMIFGDLDLDNIDNVYRMAWYLGEKCDPSDAIALAAAIDVDRSGRRYLELRNRPLVERWLALRSKAYQALLNSIHHRQNQAIFSRIVYEAMGGEERQGIIDSQDWFLTDEEVVRRLRGEIRLKPYFADLDRGGLLGEVGLGFELNRRLSRSELMQHRDALAAELAALTEHPIYISLTPYGEALARTVKFTDRVTGEEWSIGDPRRTYTLHVHIGEKAARSLGGGAAKVAVQRIVREYVRESGWINEPCDAPSAA